MTRKQKRKLFEILIGIVLLVAAGIVTSQFSLSFWPSLLIFAVPYVISGYDVIIDCVSDVASGEIFGENFLMTVATVGAGAIGEFREAVFVMIFYKVGSLFESIAVGKSRESISSLTSMKPETARIISESGETVEIPVEELKIDDVAVVLAGDRIPIDGEIVYGESSIDTSPLTGEALPVSVAVGDKVKSGCINQSGTLHIKAETVFEESTISKVVSLIESSSAAKAKSESFITTFSRFYTPSVVAAAVLLAVIPSIITGNVSEWVHRALIFLVVSCPCALVISVPLAYFGGIGRAAKSGILVKGSNHLEALSKADTVIFDKTGTLTEGEFTLTKVKAHGISDEEFIYLAAIAEQNSRHPLSRAVMNKYMEISSEPLPACEFTEEVAGLGISCRAGGHPYLAGNARFLRQNEVFPDFDDDATSIHLAAGTLYMGCAVFEDRPKKNAKSAVSRLKKSGILTCMLTGDKKSAGEAVASELELDRVHTELMPGDKVTLTEKIMSERKNAGRKGSVVFVGDGINDAPTLARADVGISMGQSGSDMAIECADIVLMDDDPAKIADAVDISKKVHRIVTQNIVFALGIKAIVLILGALGIALMWEAVFADVGVSVIAILNSMRLLRK